MVTLNDVAEKAGVSARAVSHAVNGTGRLAPETRKRILEVVRELGYRKNYAASSLRSGDSRIIGMVLPSLKMYLYDLIVPLEKEFREQGYSLLCTFFERKRDHLKEFAEAMERILQMNVCAVITPTFENVPKTATPVIIWGNDVPGFDCVFSDKKQFGHAVVERLWKMGHRRIGAAGLMRDVKFAGMREALQQRGSSLFTIFHQNTIDLEKFGISVIQDYVKLREKPTVIVFHTEEIAAAALGEALRLGIRIPEQLCLVGSDNLTAYKNLKPSLATYSGTRTNPKLLVEVTLNRIRHPELPLQRSRTLYHFVSGDSLCPVKEMKCLSNINDKPSKEVKE